jgi:hypothetical protein
MRAAQIVTFHSDRGAYPRLTWRPRALEVLAVTGAGTVCFTIGRPYAVGQFQPFVVAVKSAHKSPLKGRQTDSVSLAATAPCVPP